MNKHFFHLAAIATAITALCSCGNSGSGTIDYLPCKLERGQDYGFVDNKGNVYLTDEYKRTPSNVVEGVFSVKEEGAWNLYAFDKKKPKLILEGLKEVGMPNNGILPVVREDSRIEIVNLKGKTVLELAQFEGNDVVYCAPSFNEYGWLEVYTIDNEANIHKILIDKKGNVIFSPKSTYDTESWTLINKNLIFGLTAHEEGEAADGIAFNLKNEKVENWSKLAGMQDGTDIIDGYMIVNDGDRIRIYDSNGNGKEELMKCPDKVRSIQSIKGKQIVFKGKDYSYGVMNFKGETIIPAKYRSIEILDNGFLVNKSGEKYEILNKKGEKDRKIDLDVVVYLHGFGWIGLDGKDYYILNDKFEPLHKTELYDIDINDFGDGENLSSYYFDPNAVVGKAVSALKTDLQNAGFVVGNTAENIPAVKNTWIENIGRYTSSFSKVIAAGNGYVVGVYAHFDDYLKKNNELNAGAKIDALSLTVAPFGAINGWEQVLPNLTETMAADFTKEDDKNFSTKDYTFKLVPYGRGKSSKIEIVIRHKEPVSEEEAELNEFLDTAVEVVAEIVDEIE